MLLNIFCHFFPHLIHVYFFFLQCAERTADRIDAVVLPPYDIHKNPVHPGKCHARKQLFCGYRLLICLHFFRQILLMVENLGGILPAFLKFIRNIFIHLIFEQLLHQFLTRIFLFALFVHFFREQHP